MVWNLQVQRAAAFLASALFATVLLSGCVSEDARTQLDWYPTLTTGTISGQAQAAWSVTGNSNYIALGGEFPTVNSTGQQGLVRFAIKSLAPNKAGPHPFATLTPSAAAASRTEHASRNRSSRIRR